MHKSRLCGFIIDCQDADMNAAGRFWSQALGWPVRAADVPASGPYVKLETGPDGLNVEVQTVSHSSRVHLDIETDNVPAEVKRLEALGAKVVNKVETWVVMEAPTGHRFCVVRAQHPQFETTATRWD